MPLDFVSFSQITYTCVAWLLFASFFFIFIFMCVFSLSAIALHSFKNRMFSPMAMETQLSGPYKMKAHNRMRNCIKWDWQINESFPIGWKHISERISHQQKNSHRRFFRLFIWRKNLLIETDTLFAWSARTGTLFNVHKPFSHIYLHFAHFPPHACTTYFLHTNIQCSLLATIYPEQCMRLTCCLAIGRSSVI